ncbi:MAG: tetratricopeptide repeat protein [Bacteroidia bacterium]
MNIPDTQWFTLNQEALRQFQSGEYGHAVVLGQQALTLAAADIGEKSADYAILLNNLGLYFQYQQDYTASRKYLLQSLALWQEMEWEKDANYCLITRNLGQTLTALDQDQEAEACYLASLSAMREIENAEYAFSLLLLGNVYLKLERYEEGVKVMTECAETREKIFGSANPQYGIAINNLGEMYRRWGKFEEAEPLLVKAASIFFDSLGEKHNEYINTRNTLMVLNTQKGNYAEAESIGVDCLRLREEVLGNRHPDYLENLRLVSDIKLNLGKYAETRQLLTRYISIVEAIAGKDNPLSVRARYSLAQLYIKVEQYEAASVILNESLRFLENQLSPPAMDYATVLNDLGSIAYYQKEQEAALGYYRKGLQVLENIPEKRDWGVYVNLLNNLAISLMVLGLYRDAAPLLEESLEIKASVLGNTHPAYILTLSNLGQLKNHNGEFQEACRIASLCVKIISETYGTDFPEYDNYLNNLGEAHRNLGEYARAIEVQQNCLQIRKKLWGENHEKTLTTCNNLGLAMYEAGEIEAASVIFLDVLDKMKGKEVQWVPLYPLVLMNMGNLCQTQSDYEGAKQYFSASGEIVKKVLGNEHPDLVNIYSSLGNLYILTGNFSESEKWLFEARNIGAKISTTHPRYVSVLHNLGHLYITAGRLIEGDAVLDEAAEIERKARGEETVLMGKILTHKANLYQMMGLYAEAEKAYQKIQEIFGRILGESHPEYALALNNLGLLYSYTQNYTKAESCFFRSREMITSTLGPRHPLVGTATGNLAEVYRSTGNYNSAVEHLRTALEILLARQSENHPDILTLKNNLALTYGQLGEYESAEKIFSEMLSKWDTRHPSFPVVLGNLAELFFLQGKLDETERAVRESITLLISRIHTTFHILSEKERQSFYQTLKYNIDWLQGFGVKRYASNPDFAGFLYDVLLATKGVLMQSQSFTRDIVLRSSDPVVREKYQLWKEKKEKLSWYYSERKVETQAYTEQIAELEQTINELEKALAKAAGNFGENSALRWEQIRDCLLPGEAAVEIVRFADIGEEQLNRPGYFALVITSQTQKHPELIVLKDVPESEHQLIGSYQQLISPDEKVSRSIWFETGEEEKKKWRPEDFYQRLWKPIADFLKEMNADRKVYLSPDAIFNKVNLHTFPHPEGGFLMDRTDIHLLTSTREIFLSAGEKPVQKKSRKAVLIGAPDYELAVDENLRKNTPDKMGIRLRGGKVGELNPLPGTQKEVEEIDRLLRKNNWQTAVYLGKDATESRVKSVAQTDLLHIATHGFFMQQEDMKSGFHFLGDQPATENPLLRSGLFLAGAGNSLKKLLKGKPGSQDGIFTAYEAASLDLQGVELVVLSACETGLGDVQNGEGVYGLQRAFLMAGAETLLLSLWKVSDQATEELMGNFYQLWLDLGDKRAAFRQAQQNLRIKYPSPYYWGAFVMVGR